MDSAIVFTPIAELMKSCNCGSIWILQTDTEEAFGLKSISFAMISNTTVMKWTKLFRIVNLLIELTRSPNLFEAIKDTVAVEV